MKIPSFLESQIYEGKAVLFLGAGASISARDSKGNKPPNATELTSLLSDKFLGGKYKDSPLNQVGEYSISESDLTTVQEYLREVFEVFEPSSAHRLLCSFKWWGLATTNYDRLIEQAYETTPKPLQIPKPFIENGDRVEDSLRDRKNVMLLKLHGCITRTSNSECPLILTTDQYIEHRRGRSRIFDHLNNWAFERTIIFIGHSLQDPDLRAILLQLTTLDDKRPRYYTVVPKFDEIERRFWETKKITLVQGSFEGFISSLDSKIPTSQRKLATLKEPSSFPISDHFKKKDITLSTACRQFLDIDIEYVKSITTTEVLSPVNFYKGFNPAWSAIEQNLDFPRSLSDTILADNFLINDDEHLKGMEFILIKAHAGAGKSVMLQRIAWDAAHDYDYVCLYVHPHGVINTTAIQELITLCEERIFLFVDNVADRVRELQSLIRNIGPEGRHLTVVAAERNNEWNISCSIIAPYVTQEYELKYLSHKEIDLLLDLLEKHNALGTITSANKEGRRAAFAERAGRQLLVALHEATLSKPFEDIIEDEYNNIVPQDAQRLYLTICVLNRLNVSVRAGIVARIHGIPFDEFKQRLFAPLEHVVITKYDPIIRDYMYRARHPHIAKIVFEQILRNQEKKYYTYIKCLQALNIDYRADYIAFGHMIRGRVLLDMFPNHELVKEIYKTARNLVGNASYLFHQMGIYEMHRPNGNLHESAKLLNRAHRLAPYDMAIKHSIAEVSMKTAEIARTPLEKEKLLRAASNVCASLISGSPTHSYGYHTQIKINLIRIKDILKKDVADTEQETIATLVQEIENTLSGAYQKFPGDPYILEAESQLASVLSDSKRVVESLEKAFSANNRNGFLAIRLNDFYSRCGDTEKAQSILKKALDANQDNRRLHYAYGKLLMKMDDVAGDELAYHFKRSFTPGDSNYDAQLLYGRQLFINGQLEDSKVIFNKLGLARVGAAFRNKLLYPIDRTFKGTVDRMEATYCFTARDGINDWIYCHRSNVDDSIWVKMIVGSRVSFQIAFALRGPSAYKVELEMRKMNDKN